MGSATTLYMFAIMPPQDVSLNIEAKRTEFFEKYNSTKALKPPVHIPLYDPFEMKEDRSILFEQSVTEIQSWADRQLSLRIDLCNYGFFNNPKHPVVFIDVVKNKKLKTLHSDFVSELVKYVDTADKTGSYKPYVTIGYRDVTPDIFPSVRDYYINQTFSGSFACNSFCLWKHDGKNWQVLKTFYLNGKEVQLSLF